MMHIMPVDESPVAGATKLSLTSTDSTEACCVNFASCGTTPDRGFSGMPGEHFPRPRRKSSPLLSVNPRLV